MKKLIVIIGLFLSSAAFAGGEFGLGFIQNIFVKPQLDTSVQGYSFQYSYFFNDLLGAGFQIESVTVAPCDIPKYVEVPFLFSVTARFGSDNFKFPLTIEGGPVMKITTGNVDGGGMVAFQTGLHAFVNDNIGFKFLTGPYYSRLSGTNIFAVKIAVAFLFRFD